MIHFVGAGPGAADLITMRGHQLLTEADVTVSYTHLDVYKRQVFRLCLQWY